MSDESKKEREREIVELVYGFRRLFKIDDSEQPDFIARLAPVDEPFGIEVTEFFHSESSARLDRIPGYVPDLLGGGPFRHKADRQSLTVDKVQILSGSEVRLCNVPAIIQEVPPAREYAARVAEIVHVKNEKLGPAFQKLRHINLIIRDRTGLLGYRKTSDFYSQYCTEALRTAIFGSSFREVYFVARFSTGEVFLPLKMIATLAQLYFFRAALQDTALLGDLHPESNCIPSFGGYLRAMVSGGVSVRGDGRECEVIYGDTGFLLDAELRPQLRMYCDAPLGASGDPNPSTLRALDASICEQVRSFEQKNTFSSGIAFSVRSGDPAGDQEG